ncbi:MAG: hypothetical protein M3463_17280 [Verrucomicrobiota bacterium]|nr:hypothetical protein [Verrucomicrobiota bacterium]
MPSPKARFTIIALACLMLGGTLALQAEVPGDFERLHRMIKPQLGESRWMGIPWLTSVWEAREKAAREGKPILIWAGSGGGPVGCVETQPGPAVRRPTGPKSGFV